MAGEPWTTSITRVEPNHLVVRGHPLPDLVGRRSLLEVAALLVTGALPSLEEAARLEAVALEAARVPVADVPRDPESDVSQQLAALLLADLWLLHRAGSEAERAAAVLGRVAACWARIMGNSPEGASGFGDLAVRALAGPAADRPGVVPLLEACMVASVDHGVTPPSAQATRLSATVRPSLPVAVAAGVMAITDVHGGAGTKAGAFFAECVARGGAPREAVEAVLRERLAAGQRVEGLGHRVHTEDPRRAALWRVAEDWTLAGPATACAREAGDAMAAVKGRALPVNVDGVIGALVADLGLDLRLAKALFIFGRVAGLCAHAFEEVATQKPMRRIDFAAAAYGGA